MDEIDPDVAAGLERTARVRLARMAAPTLALLPSVPLAFVTPTWAKLSWLLIAPFSIAADRLFPDTPPEAPGSA